MILLVWYIDIKPLNLKLKKKESCSPGYGNKLISQSANDYSEYETLFINDVLLFITRY